MGGEAPLQNIDLAKRNTEILVNFRDGLQSFGISIYADGDFKHYDLYQYEQWQKDRLVQAWLPIVQQMGITVSPWLDVIMAEVVCTGPLVGLAFSNRKYRMENERLKKELEASRATKESKISDAVISADRPDGKNAWTVDVDGFFHYTNKGTYLKKEGRVLRPKLTPENYEMLCKHNGKEYIDRVFKLSK